MNAGTMVIRPSESRFRMILDLLSNETRVYHYPEQEFLTYHVSQREEGWKFRYLDRYWNSCSGNGHMGTAVIHFCGGPKPSWYRIRPYPAEKRLPEAFSAEPPWDKDILGLWMETLRIALNCTGLQKPACQSSACTWCGHYCMDRLIPCSEDLFRMDLSFSGYILPKRHKR